MLSSLVRLSTETELFSTLQTFEGRVTSTNLQKYALRKLDSIWNASRNFLLVLSRMQQR